MAPGDRHRPFNVALVAVPPRHSGKPTIARQRDLADTCVHRRSPDERRKGESPPAPPPPIPKHQPLSPPEEVQPVAIAHLKAQCWRLQPTIKLHVDGSTRARSHARPRRHLRMRLAARSLRSTPRFIGFTVMREVRGGHSRTTISPAHRSSPLQVWSDARPCPTEHAPMRLALA